MLTFARFTLNQRKICTLSRLTVQLLQIMQQLRCQFPTGGCGGRFEPPDGFCFAGYIKPCPGLSLGRQVFIARQRGTDVGTKALHFIHVQSSHGCGVRVVPVKTVAGIPSIMVISVSLPFLCCVSILNSSIFCRICISYVPNSTMRRIKRKRTCFLSNGADFFCVIFCLKHASFRGGYII